MAEFLSHLEMNAKRTKEHRTKKRPTDIAPYIVVWRADEDIAVITIKNHRPSTIMQVAEIVATGLDADMLGLVFETYQARHTPDAGKAINPMTGQEWLPGEMQESVEKYDALAKGWIVEAVGAAVVNRAGDAAMMNLPFRYVGGKYLSWIEDETTSKSSQDDSHVSGGFIDNLKAIMLNPSAAQVLPDHILGLDRDERDLAVVAYLAKFGHMPMMWTAEDSNLARRMQEHGHIIRPDGT